MASWYDELTGILAPDPSREYSAVLPLSRDPRSNVVGGDQQFAMPGMVRQGLQGILDLAHGTETGKLTGPALESLLMGIGGTGLLAAPEGVGGGLLGAGPIRAYHGSPHSFEKFSSEKIGTGEGAQAYGHGLYFAEAEDVAKTYKRAGDYASRELDVINGQLSQLAREMDQYRGGTYDKFTDPRGYELKAQYDALMQKKMNLGHMYEVEINADPARFLDWDKPLSGQSPEVIDQVNRAVRYKIDSLKDDMRGADIYGKFRHRFADPNNAFDSGYPGASAALQQAGIPGIRYLDQGSRTAGQGSSNYVVFPSQDEIIQILRKYGMAVPAPVGLPNALKPPSEREY